MINKFPDPDFWQHPQATNVCFMGALPVTSQKTEGTITPREFLTPRGGAPCADLKPKATTPGRQRAPKGTIRKKSPSDDEMRATAGRKWVERATAACGVFHRVVVSSSSSSGG